MTVVTKIPKKPVNVTPRECLDPDRVKRAATASMTNNYYWWHIVDAMMPHIMHLAQDRNWDLDRPQPADATKPTIAGKSILENLNKFMNEKNVDGVVDYINNARLANMGRHGFTTSMDYTMMKNLISSSYIAQDPPSAKPKAADKPKEQPAPPRAKATKLAAGTTEPAEQKELVRPCAACRNAGTLAEGGPACTACALRESNRKCSGKLLWKAPQSSAEIEVGDRILLYKDRGVYVVRGWKAHGMLSVVPDMASSGTPGVLVSSGEVSFVGHRRR